MSALRKFSPFTTQAERAVWQFIDGKPNDIIEASPEACYRQAWGASGGLHMSCGELTDILWRLGFRPEGMAAVCLGKSRDKKAQFVLRFQGGRGDGTGTNP